jgi:hypothetical protein
MLRVLFTAMLLGLAFGTPAAAQWQYAERNGVARASVLGTNGTELALYCTAEPGDRNDMFFDFLTIPIAASTDDEELMRFTVGTWSFRMETIAAGPRERGLQRYRSRVDYADSVISNIRRQLSGGSVVRFEDTFETAAMSFNLRGSRAAIARLEAACPRLWAGALPSTQFPLTPGATSSGPGPAGRWSVRRDGPTLRAIVDGAGPTYFGLECYDGRADQTRWILQVPVDSPMIAMLDLGINVDGRSYSFLSSAMVDMQVQNGFMPFIINFAPSQQAGIIGDLRDGATRVTIPAAASGATGVATFSGAGARASFDFVLSQCGYDPTSMPGGPSSVPRTDAPSAETQSSLIPPDALAGLREAVGAIIASECTPGSPLTLPDRAFRVSGNRVVVNPGNARCTWRSNINPFCGAARCQSWTYLYEGGQFRLVENVLR